MCIFDLDGTLDLTDTRLSAEILKLSRNGTAFVTATGRTNSYVRETCRKYGIMPPRFIIADNGGTIYDNVDKKYIMRTTLQPDKRKRIIEEFIRLGGITSEVRYTDGDNVYASKDGNVKKYYEDESIIEYRDAEELIGEILDEEVDITKVTLAGNKKLMKEIMKFIKQEGIECWTDIGATKFPNKKRQNHRLDITDGETSKGEATSFLSDYTGIRDFTCIGNGPNDFSMFRYALDNNMPIIVVKNYENGELTKESEEVIQRVQEYAREIGREDKVTIASFPINGYIGRREESSLANQRRIQFANRIKVRQDYKINNSLSGINKAVIRRRQERGEI